MLIHNTIFFIKMLILYLARSEGLEPPTIGSEVRSSIQLGYERISIEWGERGDLNPRPLEPHSRALTRLSYAHHIYFNGAPGGNRTPNLRIRSPLLYPIEPQARDITLERETGLEPATTSLEG